MQPTKPELEKKIRVTLDITSQFNLRLESLEALVGAASKADVIRQALQVYEYIATRTLKGYTFKAVSKAGKTETIVILGAGPAPAAVEDEVLAV